MRDLCCVDGSSGPATSAVARHAAASYFAARVPPTAAVQAFPYLVSHFKERSGPIIGIVIPAHNECRFGRAAGAAALLAMGARWLSFTDADSEVSDMWLAEQLSLDADAVCGTVSIEDWSCHGDAAPWLSSHFHATYRDTDGHRHVHGANLGVSAGAFRRAGGFRHLPCSEDKHLVHDLAASGARIAWSARPRVVTSARRDVRAKGGFGSTLAEAVGSRRVPSP